MANQEHLDILRQGVKVWNQWRKENPDIDPDVSEADISCLQLGHADFLRANLSGANLSGANLSGAELGGVNLGNANLDGTNFAGAIMAGTALGDRDLRVVKGLETVQHRYRSPLSLNTIYLSEGQIPEIFL